MADNSDEDDCECFYNKVCLVRMFLRGIVYKMCPRLFFQTEIRLFQSFGQRPRAQRRMMTHVTIPIKAALIIDDEEGCPIRAGTGQEQVRSRAGAGQK